MNAVGGKASTWVEARHLSAFSIQLDLLEYTVCTTIGRAYRAFLTNSTHDSVPHHCSFRPSRAGPAGSNLVWSRMSTYCLCKPSKCLDRWWTRYGCLHFVLGLPLCRCFVFYYCHSTVNLSQRLLCRRFSCSKTAGQCVSPRRHLVIGRQQSSTTKERVGTCGPASISSR